MRTLVRALFILILIFLTYTFFIRFNEEPPEKRQPGESPEISSQKEAGNAMKMPKSGLFSFIGKSSEGVKKSLGSPARKEPSKYDYDWWIYNQDPEKYLQVGIQNGIVVTVYAIGKNINLKPFNIGQPVGEVFKEAPISSSLSLDYKGSAYKFELTEEDMNTRPSVKMKDMILQLYFDKFDGTLSSVRAMDKETFIKQRPYEVVYRGSLLTPAELKKDKELKIEKAAENQIFDITNVIRNQHGLESLSNDKNVSGIAYLHSKDMKNNQYFAHDSPTEGGLADRLSKGSIQYASAGENIAAHYTDAIASVEGWLNSKGHREAMLNADFTHLGVGVYGDYYTQDYVKYWNQ
ncbi:CAP domain-containing protein [Metabacillus sp. RGM 3146]|uniref:CAP domain-containing protein n=1 Tax=Metabacillus sp. RGM 3146 TaxID=3401092 RepID=UPI003B9D6E1B